MLNPFDNPEVVRGYEKWYAGRGRRADRLEKRLLAELLADFPQDASVLEVGCGTGHFTRWLAEKGYRVVGVDCSALMLAEARKHDEIQYVPGDASALPFGDVSFDIVVFITSLEFVPDPLRALSEALRVARQALLLGVLNRCSLLALARRASGRAPWNVARFFSPGDLARLVRRSAGQRLAQVRWRTTLWPVPGLGSLWLPWGGFVGMLAQLQPMRDERIESRCKSPHR